MNIIWAFIFRDLSIERSYRFDLLLKLGCVISQLAVFYFISRYFANPQYFHFVFVGIIFSGFFQFWLGVFSDAIRQEQYWGTLEPVFMSASRPIILLFSSVSGKFVIFAMEMIFIVILGKAFLGDAFNVHPLWFIPLFALNSLALGGIGLISGSFIMYFKRGDPVNFILGTAFDLLSGIYFPIAVFPEFIKYFSAILPTTSALNVWRSVLLEGKMPTGSQLAVQLAWGLALFTLGVLAFTMAFNKTREKGDLGNY
jgi:ABC-2 type transport system permease protein